METPRASACAKARATPLSSAALSRLCWRGLISRQRRLAKHFPITQSAWSQRGLDSVVAHTAGRSRPGSAVPTASRLLSQIVQQPDDDVCVTGAEQPKLDAESAAVAPAHDGGETQRICPPGNRELEDDRLSEGRTPVHPQKCAAETDVSSHTRYASSARQLAPYRQVGRYPVVLPYCRSSAATAVGMVSGQRRLLLAAWFAWPSGDFRWWPGTTQASWCRPIFECSTAEAQTNPRMRSVFILARQHPRACMDSGLSHG